MISPLIRAAIPCLRPSITFNTAIPNCAPSTPRAISWRRIGPIAPHRPLAMATRPTTMPMGRGVSSGLRRISGRAITSVTRSIPTIRTAGTGSRKFVISQAGSSATGPSTMTATTRCWSSITIPADRGPARFLTSTLCARSRRARPGTIWPIQPATGSPVRWKNSIQATKPLDRQQFLILMRIIK